MSKRFTPGASNELPSSALKAVEFYEGVQIALDSLEREGVKLFVDVFDSMRDTNTVKALLKKPELLEADLIVGPVRTNTLQLVADFALKNKTPLLSPFNPRKDIVANNPYYIQLNPSFDVYSQKIIEQMHKIKQRDRFQQLDKQILIIAKKSDSLRVQRLQSDFAIQSNDQTAVLPQYLSSNASIKVNFIRPLMDRAKFNVVLIPSTDEAFVYNCLREIQSLVNKVEPSQGYQIAVVGMNKWKYYSRITFEYYESLNLHLPSEFYVARSANKNIQFKNGYRSNYGIAPREFGYIGFDAMLYFGRMIKEYGINFQAHLWKQHPKMRHTAFQFLPNIENTSPLDGRTATNPFVRNFENKYVHFLYFSDYELKPTNYK